MYRVFSNPCFLEHLIAMIGHCYILLDTPFPSIEAYKAADYLRDNGITFNPHDDRCLVILERYRDLLTLRICRIDVLVQPIAVGES